MSENYENQIEDLMPQKELTPEEREANLSLQKKKAVDRIVRGVNDTFIKDYTFEDLDLKFTIKIKAPNALDIGKIQARAAAYLGGMNTYLDNYTNTVYQTLATIRTTGVEVPKELANDEDIYNLDILYQIGVDFKQWLDNFRL
ncbi:tail assembly chaperone [Bacillus phage vB_BmeM-Goe8]|uniref:Tail assembly chaperone n=1 Tax=Bacillus phage vB_BmeM-Goe8 TaxID=2593638 RepID=A0A516KMQ6_9CAUD|nr:tail assembly chaperone [Bacillus phage vB_BmeM-Goe8]QDP42860.1 hypothetical protein Goe8_c00870 [Bacillus phage vB_BmeM-Goe8]